MLPLIKKDFKAIMNLEKMKDNSQITQYLAYVTGHKYEVTINTSRIWGEEQMNKR